MQATDSVLAYLWRRTRNKPHAAGGFQWVAHRSVGIAVGGDVGPALARLSTTGLVISSGRGRNRKHRLSKAGGQVAMTVVALA